VDSLSYEKFALISILIYLDSLFIGSVMLSFKLAKNIYHHSLNFLVISRKTNFVFDNAVCLNVCGGYSCWGKTALWASLSNGLHVPFTCSSYSIKSLFRVGRLIPNFFASFPFEIFLHIYS